MIRIIGTGRGDCSDPVCPEGNERYGIRNFTAFAVEDDAGEKRDILAVRVYVFSIFRDQFQHHSTAGRFPDC